MAEHEKELHFTVMYRGKTLELKAPSGSTLGDLGKEIVELTGVAPHTLRLILPKRPPLQPMSEQQSTVLLYQSGIIEGMKMRMMGSSSVEVAAVSQPSTNDRIIGFSEEDQRARQRSSHALGSYSLPKGIYVFCDFQTLHLPGVELNPPPAMALKIMHKLASDRGITAIMNKYRWRVGIMTEMAPIGYVGVSPKCILGFNKNRGQEISLRLRTDDLKGFRKYESIKKTLLHELAHMVHDEHDEKFHALDRKLNEEAVALDWTKSQGHSLTRVKFNDEEEMEVGSSGSVRGYKLGGRTDHHLDARTAAAAAALRRLGDAAKRSRSDDSGESSKMTASNSSMLVPMPMVGSEPDPDAQDSQSVVGIASGRVENDDAAASEINVCVSINRQEPDPDEASGEPVRHKEPDPDEANEPSAFMEPDPDDPNEHSAYKEPDPDAAVHSVQDCLLRSQEPDPDEASSGVTKNEPDPDEVMGTLRDAPQRIQQPDPDAEAERRQDSNLRYHEPDPDEASLGHSGHSEPDPDEGVDPGDHPFGSHEPDPDEAVDIISEDLVQRQEPGLQRVFAVLASKSEPDPDEAADSVLDTPVRKHEPDPDEASGDHSGNNVQNVVEEVGIVLDTPLRRQEPDPDADQGHDSDAVHVHNKNTGDIYLDECVGCRQFAGKRMKSSTGSGFTELAKSQMSR